jgi:hypothetical protein
VELPALDDDLDLLLRDVTRRFPEHLARALLPAGTAVTSARWADTQLASRQRRLDRALEVVVGSARRFEHVEWQLEMTADVPFRVHEYHMLASFALQAETPAGEQTSRIRSTVVLLSGRDKPWPEHGTYRTSPDDEPFSGVTFRIDAVYQRTLAELEARGPVWAIFAPLAVDADATRMREVLDRLRAASTPRDFGELAAALTVTATKDKRQRGLRGAILALLSEEDVMQISVYELGWQHGEQAAREAGELKGGLKILGQLYELRLGRALAEEERATLQERLGKLGAARLLVVQRELSPDALAAWLGDSGAS